MAISYFLINLTIAGRVLYHIQQKGVKNMVLYEISYYDYFLVCLTDLIIFTITKKVVKYWHRSAVTVGSDGT